MAFKYFKDSVQELHRVTWPTKQQSAVLVAVVIAFTIACGVFLGVVDSLFSLGWKALLHLATA